jgi:hypothetical protein
MKGRTGLNIAAGFIEPMLCPRSREAARGPGLDIRNKARRLSSHRSQDQSRPPLLLESDRDSEQSSARRFAARYAVAINASTPNFLRLHMMFGNAGALR